MNAGEQSETYERDLQKQLNIANADSNAKELEKIREKMACGDIVAVIRCKNCRSQREKTGKDSYKYCSLTDRIHGDDYFCSDGKPANGINAEDSNYWLDKKERG